MKKKWLRKMVNKKDLEMLEEEVVNATSLKEFSPLGYCFCHYIENFSDYTVKQFLKNCTLEELLEMEKDYLESWELVFHRQSFKKAFGDYMMTLPKPLKKKIVKMSIEEFYNDLHNLKHSPIISKAIERLEL